MAILQDTSSSSAVRCLFNTPPSTDLAPRGTYRSKIVDIIDKYDVERRKFDKPTETERVDLTQFRLGFRDRNGAPWTVDSRPMKISGNERSALFAFLKSILGTAPKMGWDYTVLKGTDVLLTIDHQPSRTKPGVVYAVIASISPLPEGYGEQTAPAQPQPAAPSAPPAASVEDTGDPIPF